MLGGLIKSMAMYEDSQFRKMMEIVNRHLPSKRRPLDELLKEKETDYEAKDGNRYRIKKGELEYLATLVDGSEMHKLRLPIIIMTDTSGQTGAWKVMGQLEVKVVSQVIDREPEFQEEMRIFHPHMAILRRKLPTATTCMYSP
jgi:uncharacterized protein